MTLPARPPHIHTLTGNLLWEQTLSFPSWSPGSTQRASAQSSQVGGKGINVSKMLNRLGDPNTALCFTGGFSGAACRSWLKAHRFAFRAFPTRGATRTGVVVRGGAGPETTFLGPDTPPGAAAVRACAAFLDAQPDGGCLALCGSLPGWSSPDFDPLRSALDRWAARGLLVADTYGPALAWLAQRPVGLIKINRSEFDALHGAGPGRRGPAGDFPGRLRDARRRWAARAWVVTDGGRPVFLADERGATAAFRPPAVREVSPTGSGDVLLACLLHARLHLGHSLRRSVAFALPYAAANAGSPGIADFAEPGPAK
jgi:fructose-1-phosphate kinase PfkB-like protein